MGAESQRQGLGTLSKLDPSTGVSPSLTFSFKKPSNGLSLWCLTLEEPQAFTPLEAISFKPSSDVRTFAWLRLPASHDGPGGRRDWSIFCGGVETHQSLKQRRRGGSCQIQQHQQPSSTCEGLGTIHQGLLIHSNLATANTLQGEIAPTFTDEKMRASKRKAGTSTTLSFCKISS